MKTLSIHHHDTKGCKFFCFFFPFFFLNLFLFSGPGGFTCYLQRFGVSTLHFPGIRSILEFGSLICVVFAHIVEFLSFICLVFAAFSTLDPSITSYSQTFRSFHVGLRFGFMPTYKHVSILLYA